MRLLCEHDDHMESGCMCGMCMNHTPVCCGCLSIQKTEKTRRSRSSAMDRDLAQKGYVCAIDILRGTGWPSEGLLQIAIL